MTKRQAPKPTTHAERVKAERGTYLEKPDDDAPGLLTPFDILTQFHTEVTALSRAADLRIREYTDFATAYAQGDLTPEEANDRFYAYHARWDDPIPGITSVDGMSDAEIYKAMDDARNSRKGKAR